MFSRHNAFRGKGKRVIQLRASNATLRDQEINLGLFVCSECDAALVSVALVVCWLMAWSVNGVLVYGM